MATRSLNRHLGEALRSLKDKQNAERTLQYLKAASTVLTSSSSSQSKPKDFRQEHSPVVVQPPPVASLELRPSKLSATTFRSSSNPTKPLAPVLDPSARGGSKRLSENLMKPGFQASSTSTPTSLFKSATAHNVPNLSTSSLLTDQELDEQNAAHETAALWMSLQQACAASSLEPGSKGSANSASVIQEVSLQLSHVLRLTIRHMARHGLWRGALALMNHLIAAGAMFSKSGRESIQELVLSLPYDVGNSSSTASPENVSSVTEEKYASEWKTRLDSVLEPHPDFLAAQQEQKIKAQLFGDKNRKFDSSSSKSSSSLSSIPSQQQQQSMMKTYSRMVGDVEVITYSDGSQVINRDTPAARRKIKSAAWTSEFEAAKEARMKAAVKKSGLTTSPVSSSVVASSPPYVEESIISAHPHNQPLSEVDGERGEVGSTEESPDSILEEFCAQVEKGEGDTQFSFEDFKTDPSAEIDQRKSTTTTATAISGSTPTTPRRPRSVPEIIEEAARAALGTDQGEEGGPHTASPRSLIDRAAAIFDSLSLEERWEMLKMEEEEVVPVGDREEKSGDESKESLVSSVSIETKERTSRRVHVLRRIADRLKLDVADSQGISSEHAKKRLPTGSVRVKSVSQVGLATVAAELQNSTLKDSGAKISTTVLRALSCSAASRRKTLDFLHRDMKVSFLGRETVPTEKFYGTSSSSEMVRATRLLSQFNSLRSAEQRKSRNEKRKGTGKGVVEKEQEKFVTLMNSLLFVPEEERSRLAQAAISPAAQEEDGNSNAANDGDHTVSPKLVGLTEIPEFEKELTRHTSALRRELHHFIAVRNGKRLPRVFGLTEAFSNIVFNHINFSQVATTVRPFAFDLLVDLFCVHVKCFEKLGEKKVLRLHNTDFEQVERYEEGMKQFLLLYSKLRDLGFKVHGSFDVICPSDLKLCNEAVPSLLKSLHQIMKFRLHMTHELRKRSDQLRSQAPPIKDPPPSSSSEPSSPSLTVSAANKLRRKEFELKKALSKFSLETVVPGYAPAAVVLSLLDRLFQTFHLRHGGGQAPKSRQGKDIRQKENRVSTKTRQFTLLCLLEKRMKQLLPLLQLDTTLGFKRKAHLEQRYAELTVSLARRMDLLAPNRTRASPSTTPVSSETREREASIVGRRNRSHHGKKLSACEQGGNKVVTTASSSLSQSMISKKTERGSTATDPETEESLEILREYQQSRMWKEALNYFTELVGVPSSSKELVGERGTEMNTTAATAVTEQVVLAAFKGPLDDFREEQQRVTQPLKFRTELRSALRVVENGLEQIRNVAGEANDTVSRKHAVSMNAALTPRVFVTMSQAYRSMGDWQSAARLTQTVFQIPGTTTTAGSPSSTPSKLQPSQRSSQELSHAIHAKMMARSTEVTKELIRLCYEPPKPLSLTAVNLYKAHAQDHSGSAAGVSLTSPTSTIKRRFWWDAETMRTFIRVQQSHRRWFSALEVFSDWVERTGQLHHSSQMASTPPAADQKEKDKQKSAVIVFDKNVPKEVRQNIGSRIVHSTTNWALALRLVDMLCHENYRLDPGEKTPSDGRGLAFDTEMQEALYRALSKGKAPKEIIGKHKIGGLSSRKVVVQPKQQDSKWHSRGKD